MKKIVLFAAVAAMGLASCTSQAPKANLKSDIDSLSYMIGVNQGNGLSEVATTHMGIDSAYVAEFLKGIEAGAAEGASATNAKALAFVIGKQIGLQASGLMFNQINGNIFGKDSETSLSKDNFLAGLLAVANNKAVVTTTDAQAFINAQLDAIKEKAMEKQYADNKAAGEKFLAENATKEGVKTTESGLQYKVIKEGKGEIPTKESTVKVHYKGTLIDGTEFDSSYKREEPTSFRADRVIAGWTEALTMMPVGSKWELYIPQELAYGSRQTGEHIKPFSALVFEVELLEIEKK
jgi:FKBP-type peptidyl-prolyl cis-trans isomerase FklB